MTLREALIEAIERLPPRGAFHETAGYVDAVLAAVPDAALAAPAAEPREDGALSAYQRGYVDGFDAPVNVTARAAAQPGPSEPGLRERHAALADAIVSLLRDDPGAFPALIADEHPRDVAYAIAQRLVKRLAAADSAPGEGLDAMLAERDYFLRWLQATERALGHSVEPPDDPPPSMTVVVASATQENP